jgi:hypothetical protein
MAKISFYGSWIDVKSLNKIDKINYLTSMVFIVLGAFAWGVHLAGSETGFLGENNEGGPNTGIIFTFARLAVVVCWTIAITFYIKFLKTQDELFQRYHDYVLSWGSLGFVFLGVTISLAAPYFDFQPSYYEFFLAFAIGAIVGGARFHKEYLK